MNGKKSYLSERRSRLGKIYYEGKVKQKAYAVPLIWFFYPTDRRKEAAIKIAAVTTNNFPVYKTAMLSA